MATFYDYQQKRCLPCPVGCLTCDSSYVCEICKPEFTYDAHSQLCKEHCGDGMKFMLECDDGNNVNGDGCSSTCEIETLVAEDDDDPEDLDELIVDGYKIISSCF